MKVTVQTADNFTPARRSKLDQAVALMAQVLSSPDFAADVLKYPFMDDSGLTNEGILTKLSAGAELLDPVADQECDLYLKIYWPSWFKKWSVIGYGYANERTIYCNGYWFDRMTIAEIAGNLAHEWCHKAGFEHDFRATNRRPNSVPYAIGNLVEHYAKKFLGLPT